MEQTGKERCQSVVIAERGIRTSGDFANLMSAMMSDLALGRLTPQVGNAMCNAGGKLLKVVEMQQKYGVEGEGQHKVLMLSDAPPPALENGSSPLSRDA